MQPLVFDVHLDLSMNAMEWNRDLRLPLVELRRRELGLKDFVDRTRGVVTLPEMRRGRVGLCVATQIARYVNRFSKLPGWASPEQAWAQTQGQLAWYRAMEEAGELFQIRDLTGLEKHLALWQTPLPTNLAVAPHLPIGYILSLEGADSLHTLGHLERAHGQGLRAIGLTHYGPGLYGHGTDDSGGLPSRAYEMMKEMRRLNFILDATHLNDQCFWEAMKVWDGPVWASHSNCRALADWNRQFTDDQIRELVRHGAVIGVALDAIMLVHGWTHLRSTPQDFHLTLDRVVDHIDHICQLAGNAEHVGIGTDLDGGYGTEQLPMDLDSIADLQKLAPLLAKRGYSDADVNRIFQGNFLGFLRNHWR